MCVLKKKAWLRQFRKRLLAMERRRQRDENPTGAVEQGRPAQVLPTRAALDEADTNYNAQLTAGIGAAGRAAVARSVWGIEELTPMEQKYIARRAGTAPAFTVDAQPDRTAHQRRVVATRPILRHEVILREATPLFAPRKRRCAGCDAPRPTVTCGSCGARYCSTACRDKHEVVHSLECWFSATRCETDVRIAYARGGGGQHTASHLPVQAWFLNKRTPAGWTQFLHVIRLMCRSVGLVQTVRGRFVAPSQVPLLSMLPYRPVPPLLGMPRGGQMGAPPVEVGLLYHLARGAAEVYDLDFDHIWEHHLDELWHLWELAVFNAHRGHGAIHPVVSLFPHAPAPTLAVHHPTNQLAYVVASRDIAQGEALTLDYTANLPGHVSDADRERTMRALGWGRQSAMA